MWKVAISTRSTSCFLARNTLLHDRAGLVPATSAIHNLHHRKHDRNFDQHPDNSRQCCTRIKAEKANCGGNGQFEEVAGADERGWCGDAMRFTGDAIQKVGQSRVEIDSNQDWQSQNCNN